jgi:hypothetical protein
MASGSYGIYLASTKSFYTILPEGADRHRDGPGAGETIEEQIARTLENVKLILEAAGATLADVVKATIQLSDSSLSHATTPSTPATSLIPSRLAQQLAANCSEY